MARRNLLSLLVLFAVSALTAPSAGAASARTAPSHASAGLPAAGAGPPAPCVLHSLPSFVAQGENTTAATVADVVEVECNPALYGTGSKIKIIASQLLDRCEGHLTWYVPSPFREESGRGISVELDADG